MNFEKSSVLDTESGFTSEQFWSAVNIYLKTPHSVSRRLCGAVELFRGCLLKSPSYSFEEFYDRVASCDLGNKSSDEIFAVLTRAEVVLEVGSCGQEDLNLLHVDNVTRPRPRQKSSIIVNKLLPRNSDVYDSCLELVILEHDKDMVTFAPLNCNTEGRQQRSVATKYPFSIQLVGDEMQLLVQDLKDKDKSLLWLRTNLFPKLVKWASSSDCPNAAVKSLSLVTVDSYSCLYQQLKKKYGKSMVDIWPEVTDPSKFVYEDIAIATYLLLIWEKEREEKGWPIEKKQSFVDLGCGNGLLVYILSSEGHEGIGLDVRKRRIWDNYPKTTKLELRSLNPSDDCRFPETDWLIGNHSDELTPWVPVWAAQSSYNCRFLLLPCCCYDFFGNKYQRVNTSHSVYEDYLEFVKEISDICGFHIEADKLRIPSTRRICLIGGRRNYPFEEHKFMVGRIDGMIESRSASQQRFKPRPAVEKVRNCTQLKKGVVEDVVKLVAVALLSETEHEGEEWNAGGQKTVKELADLIPKETLQELKSECGGLQTLLKNNWRVFQVCNGSVQLRKPLSSSSQVVNEKATKKRKVACSRQGVPKQQQCWFNAHHPNGCPLLDVDCPNMHC